MQPQQLDTQDTTELPRADAVMRPRVEPLPPPNTEPSGELDQPNIHAGSQEVLSGRSRQFWSLKRVGIITLAFLVLSGVVILLLRHRTPTMGIAAGNFNTVQLPLATFAQTGTTAVPLAQTLSVSGTLQVGSSLVLAPTLQPVSATAGQIYYDKTANQLEYYNGSQFVSVNGGTTSIQNTTQNTTQNFLNNSTTNINGALNAVTSSGGTAGTIALFTGGKTIGNSIITQTGSVVNVGGNINLVNTTPGTPMTIWAPSTTPLVASFTDPGAVEVGIKFQSDVNGIVTGMRFYKGALNTGTHIGNLWTTSGTLLASVTFTGESASGWQQATFATPVAISADTTYIISYHSNVGFYSTDTRYFSNKGFDNPPLHALQDGADGSNGVFSYSATSVFPSNQSGGGTNYWVDVIYTPDSNPGIIEINGAQITSSALANNFDIAKRGSGQVFTGINTFRNSTDSGAGFVIQNAASVPLLTADTAGSQIIISKLIVAGNITINGHYVTNGVSPPAVAPGPAACTAATANAVGSDTAGLLTVTTGTGCPVAGILATVTFNTVYANAPRVALTAANANAALLSAYIDSSTASPTAFDLRVAGGTIASTTTYKWYYVTLQ